MNLKSFIFVYHLYFTKIWQNLFNNYTPLDVRQQSEYLDYLSTKLHHRIILSAPLVTVLMITKIIIYFFILNTNQWLSISLTNVLLTDSALLIILYKSVFTTQTSEKYYKEMLALGAFSLLSCTVVYLYSMINHIYYPYEIIGLGILLFLWIFNYPFTWTILVPMITILLFAVFTFIFRSFSAHYFIEVFMLLITFLIGAFYSLMNGANEYNLFLAFKDAESQALIDNLTKILNRRGFLKQLNAIRKISQREKKVNYLAILDIDDFKSINDQYGHDIGDKVIFSVAKQLTQLYRRPLDLVARWGGEEFIVYWCEDHQANNPLLMGQKICLKIANQHLTLPYHQQLSFSVSIGISQIQDNDLFDEALKRADLALYKAKSNGKNQAVVN